MREGYGTRLLVLANASAGGAEQQAVRAAAGVLAAVADVTVETCDDPGDLDRVLDRRGDRTLVVAGGDGSLHLTVTTLRRRGELDPAVPLGLLPMGTGNDLARTLGLPLDPTDAAQAILSGRARHLDLLVDGDSGVVVNAVHGGVGAVAAERAASLKPALGSTAYPIGGVAAGVTSSGWEVTVTVDGRTLDLDGPALMVAVANGRTIGGGAPLAPDAAPDDGLLDVVVATSTGPLARLGFGAALREGEHVDRDDVIAIRGMHVTVQGEPMPWNADGELQEPAPSREWQVEPGAWSVLVPTSLVPTSSAGSG